MNSALASNILHLEYYTPILLAIFLKKATKLWMNHKNTKKEGLNYMLKYTCIMNQSICFNSLNKANQLQVQYRSKIELHRYDTDLSISFHFALNLVYSYTACTAKNSWSWALVVVFILWICILQIRSKEFSLIFVKFNIIWFFISQYVSRQKKKKDLTITLFAKRTNDRKMRSYKKKKKKFTQLVKETV